ncbi:5805_t:CDS:2 [Funneliformis caledonium]|uniref:5805_t:CDS:1 n=1 Tax=Funneliformis caledonium TaxID=1117310 RepID=A0A9N9H2Y7_9GLOM|nr:5805_t:CDS:2 [Funneliformis caledonium]
MRKLALAISSKLAVMVAAENNLLNDKAASSTLIINTLAIKMRIK